MFLGNFLYPYYRVVIIGVAVACVAGLWLLLQKTAFGRVVRAGVQNPDMVGALGISLEPYMAAVAFLGVGLAGLAGVMLAPIFSIHPAMGQEIITSAFVVVVIGGLGSFWGVVAAAIIVGLTKASSPQWATRSSRKPRSIFLCCSSCSCASARALRRAYPALRVSDHADVT